MAVAVVPKRAGEFPPAIICVHNFCIAAAHSSSLSPFPFQFSQGMGAGADVVPIATAKQ